MLLKRRGEGDAPFGRNELDAASPADTRDRTMPSGASQYDDHDDAVHKRHRGKVGNLMLRVSDGARRLSQKKAVWFLALFFVAVFVFFFVGRVFGSMRQGPKRPSMVAMRNKWLLQNEHEVLKKQFNRNKIALEECDKEISRLSLENQKLESRRLLFQQQKYRPSGEH